MSRPLGTLLARSLSLVLALAFVGAAWARSPVIKKVEPESVAAGGGVSIHGKDFVPKKLPEGKIHYSIRFDDVGVGLRNAGGTELRTRVPAQLKPGKYSVQFIAEVTTGEGDEKETRIFARSNKKRVTVGPRVTRVSPGAAYEGQLVTIQGGPFIPKTGSVKPVVFVGGKSVPSKMSEDGSIITFTLRKGKEGNTTIEVRMGSSKSAPSSGERGWRIVAEPEKAKKPIITKFDPAKPIPGDTVKVIGKNFAKGCLIELDGRGVGGKVVSETEMEFRLDLRTTPGPHKIRVNFPKAHPAPVASPTRVLTVDGFKPKATEIEPRETVPGGPVRIRGEQFGPGCVVVFNGIEIKAGIRGTTEVNFNIPTTASPGSYSVTVKYGTKTSKSMKIKVRDLNPILKKLSPEKGYPGEFASVQGDEFGHDKVSSAKVFVNGKETTTQYYGNQALRFMVPFDAPPGRVSVDVRYGSKKTSSLSFEILVREPTLRVVPQTLVPGATIMVSGRGFLTGTTVTVGGRPLEIVELKYDQITCKVPDDMSAGKYKLTVSVPKAGTPGPRDVEVTKPPSEEGEN